MARSLDSVETRAEVDAVHVELQDLLLTHFHLDAEGHSGFQELAIEGLSSQGEAVAGELLSDRAGSLLHSPEEQISDGGTCDA